MNISTLFRQVAGRRLLALALLASPALPASSAVLLQDSFLNGNKALPDSSSIGNWTFVDSTVTEAGGLLTVSTSNGTASNSSNFSTSVSPELNPFTSTIQFSVSDFSLFGTGDYEGAPGRFRMGLISTAGSFFGTNDAFALEINSNGLGFKLGTKLNAVNADPGAAAASGTFASAITSFDFIFTATTWDLVLYSGTDVLYDQSGSWSLGSADTWGANTGNTGSSALLLALQNSGATGTSGNKSFSIGEITVTATAIPEPSRLLLMGGAFCALLARRRRPLAPSC